MKAEFASEADKILFLKYAVPCGTTLVNRGDLTESRLDELRAAASSGRVDGIEPGETFSIAAGMCRLVAKKLGRDKIDSEVIRQYFWNEHKDAIAWRSQVFRDVRPETCNIYAGQVSFVEEFAHVKTRLGTLKYRKDFLPGVKKGDFVLTHYDHVVEKIDRPTALKLGFTV